MVTVIHKRNDEISDPIDFAKSLDLENTRYILADIRRMKGNNGPSIVTESCSSQIKFTDVKTAKGENNHDLAISNKESESEALHPRSEPQLLEMANNVHLPSEFTESGTTLGIKRKRCTISPSFETVESAQKNCTPEFDHQDFHDAPP